MINVDKPLWRHQWIKDKGGQKVKVELKYERLHFYALPVEL